MASKIDLVSNALILIGDKPINTLVGNSRAQTVAANLYDNIVQAELSKHFWGFARRKAQLSLTTDAPIDDEWRSVYQLPTDLITLIKIKPLVPFQRYGDKVYCNLNQKLTCDYISNVAESEWPVYFAKMIEYALAKDFANSITDNASAADRLAIAYADESRKARYTDSIQHPQTAIVDAPFINARF